MNRYLTDKEASELTGMSVSWFQRERWKKSGPPFIKLDGAVRYREEDLRAWFDSKRVEFNPSTQETAS